MTVTVIIPAYKPDEKFQRLMEMLKKQTAPIEKILIMNTEEKYWKPSFLQGLEQAEVRHISKEEFDHGGTRALGASMTNGDILVYFTQDAVPADDRVIEKLTEPFCDPRVGAVYGRQLPNRDCKEAERFTRAFNYPGKSFQKTKEDLSRLGIKTFFCSNVCAAYRRETYEKMGGFIRRTIFNEDMILAGNMIKAGYAVAYASEARVFHSHNYGWTQQLKRNFDLAVSQADHPEIFSGISSESEGIRLVKAAAIHLLKCKKPWLLPDFFIASGFKFLGYRLGKAYRRLPMGLVKKCTMNPSYWTKKR